MVVVVEKVSLKVGGVCNIRRAGMVKRRTKKRVVARLDWIEHDLLLALGVVRAMMVVISVDGEDGMFLRTFNLAFVVVSMAVVGIWRRVGKICRFYYLIPSAYYFFAFQSVLLTLL